MLGHVQRIVGEKCVSGIRTYAGQTIGCDAVVLASGVRPAVELAVEAGLQVTGCGSCKPLLAQFAGSAAALPSLIGAKTLLGATAGACFLVALFALWPPVIPAGSVRAWWHPEILWLDGTWKQVSGYSLAVLSLLALLLSLRKRWMRFSFARFESWRLLHTIIGVVTLVLLILHTGWRLGRSPLDHALMLSFLGVNLSGAIAGTLTVAGSRSADLKWLIPVHFELEAALVALKTA
ncbi:MAG: hypothetical protein ACREV1_04890 [Gammaproteobacteria bacterium]